MLTKRFTEVDVSDSDGKCITLPVRESFARLLSGAPTDAVRGVTP